MSGIVVFVGEPFKSRRIMQQHRKDEHLKDIVLTNKFAGYHPDVNKPCRFCGTIFKKQSGLTLDGLIFKN